MYINTYLFISLVIMIKSVKTSSSYYTQKDFEQIINKGISYTIPMDILNIIRKLEDKVKQTTAISAATISHKHNHHHPANKPHETVMPMASTDWKKTKSVTIKTNSPMNQIKLLLNKLSPTNYNKLKAEIITLLEDSNLLTCDVGSEILIFLSRTKEISMSQLYMELFSALVQSFPTIFQPIFFEFENKYKDHLMNQIPGMAPDEENPEYLEYMKNMSDLRGQTIFLAHWYCHHHCPDHGVQIINTLLRQIEIILTETSGRNKTKIDEWTEQIFLWIKILGKMEVSTNYPETWKHMEVLSQLNIKTAPNMTSRSKFKYQEILRG